MKTYLKLGFRSGIIKFVHNIQSQIFQSLKNPFYLSNNVFVPRWNILEVLNSKLFQGLFHRCQPCKQPPQNRCPIQFCLRFIGKIGIHSAVLVEAQNNALKIWKCFELGQKLPPIFWRLIFFLITWSLMPCAWANVFNQLERITRTPDIRSGW